MGILVLSSCSNSGNNANNNQVSSNSFKGGKDALKIEFQDNMPPETITDQGLESFNVRLKVTNLGEYDIPEGTSFVKLANIDPQQFNLNESNIVKPLPSLRGYKVVSGNEINPIPIYVSFSNMKFLGNLPSGGKRTLQVYACYPYETNAIGTICISPEPYNIYNNDLSNCEIEGSKEIKSSSGPLVIKNLKQSPYDQNSIQVQFEIVDQSSDTLKIYKSDSVDNQCLINGSSLSSTEAFNKENKVIYNVTIPTIDKSKINCEYTNSNQNTILLNEGKPYLVTCVINTENEIEKEDSIIINLKYDVVDKISKEINIEHVYTSQ